LERCFGAACINTDTVTDLSTLTAALMTNFVTVRFRRIGPEWDWPRPLSDSEFRRMEQGMRTERQICHYRRAGLRTALGLAGYHRFFDYIEGDIIGDWRLHVFSADTDAVALVAENTDGIVGPGAPIDFDPPEFVGQRLQCLEKYDRLTGGYAWWDGDF